MVHKVESKFTEIATRHQMVAWAEESQFALQAIQKNAKLAGCQVHTVQNSIINVASVGLTLNPALGYAYLVPEGVKQKGSDGRDIWIDECILRVSFKGLLKIATDSGSIKWAKAEVVKESDSFEYRGPCQMPAHTMNPFGDRGKTVGSYCIAKTHEGDILVDVMAGDEIQKIRNAAKTKAVWDAWPDEMAKKAIIKRASKQWPKTDRDDRLDLAVAAVNEYEGSEAIDNAQDEYLDLVADNQDSIQAIKKGIQEDDLSTAAEAWFELSDEVKRGLWKAPSKGGVFTTLERSTMQKSEFRKAHFGD
jgi:recombination protein RecT